jgi:hypothetical protein
VSEGLKAISLKLIFALQWLVIGAISSYDCYLSIKFQDQLHHNEMNPLGKLLLDLDGGNVALFMGLKFFTTIIVLGVLVLLYDRKPGLAHKVITPVLLFQVCLLLFMETH